mgnify:CR=1 FL=1
MSTNIGVAPTILIASAVAIKVCGVVITSCPFVTPHAIKDNTNAKVPLPTAAQFADLVAPAHASSNFSTVGPAINSDVSNIF